MQVKGINHQASWESNDAPRCINRGCCSVVNSLCHLTLTRAWNVKVKQGRKEIGTGAYTEPDLGVIYHCANAVTSRGATSQFSETFQQTV